MSPKALRGLALAFAVLAALWGARAVLDSRAARPRLLFAQAEAAEALTLRGPNGEVRLRKVDGAWRMESPFASAADGPALAAALAELAKARVSGTLSDDPARLPLFALQDSSATRLTVEGPQSARLDVLLGGPGAEAASVFIRDPGSAEVREAGGLSRWRRSARPGFWADKTLAALDPSRVSRLSVRSPKGLVVLERTDGVWRRPGAPAVLSSAAAARLGPLLQALERFSADDVLDAAALEAEPRVRLDRVEFEVRVETLDYAGAPGQTAGSFTVSPQGQDYRHLARVKGRDAVVYSLSGWRLEPFRLDPKDIK